MQDAHGREMQTVDRTPYEGSEEDCYRLVKQKVSDPFQVDFMTQGQSELNHSLSLLHLILPDIDLTNIQTAVFLQSWQGRTYQQIAESTGYDPDYLKDVGHKLWRKLSAELGEPISKHNFCSVLRRRSHEVQELEAVKQAARVLQFPRRVDRIEQSRPACDWGEAPLVSVFTGRGDELSLLERWVIADQNSLVGIFGLGGIGKTALAVKGVEKLSAHFDFTIWRSLRNTPDFGDLVTSLLKSLDSQNHLDIPENPVAKVSLLLQCLNQHRCLLVIDDWSSVLRGDSLAGGYQNKYGHYGLLLRRLSESRHRSCVLIIGREKPSGLAFRDNPVFPVRSLYLTGLTQKAGRETLKAFGLSATDANLDKLLEHYDGNPYVLRVVAKTVIDLFGCDISRFLQQNDFIYGDIRGLLSQQFNRLSKLERLIMHCLVNSPEQISIEDLKQKFPKPGRTDLLLEGLESLYHRSFVEKQDTTFRLPWLVRKYAAYHSSSLARQQTFAIQISGESR